MNICYGPGTFFSKRSGLGKDKTTEIPAVTELIFSGGEGQEIKGRRNEQIMKGEGNEQGRVWRNRSCGVTGTRRVSPLRPQGGQRAASQKLGVVLDRETRDLRAGLVRRPVRLWPGASALGSHGGQWTGPRGQAGRAQEPGLALPPQGSCRTSRS